MQKYFNIDHQGTPEQESYLGACQRSVMKFFAKLQKVSIVDVFCNVTNKPLIIYLGRESSFQLHQLASLLILDWTLSCYFPIAFSKITRAIIS